ncbi:MAG: phosphopantothenoylcysteine decarboxylase [Candidatus Paceibacterota bacterium]
MNETLKGKKILVTGGSTWVPIDNVRVITNVFGGTTGYRIAIQAAKMGADVTLLLGPHRIEDTTVFIDEPVETVLAKMQRYILEREKIAAAGGRLEIVHYDYFQELMDLMEKYVSTRQFHAVIHSSAVADYAPTKQDGKISSGLNELSIRTTPTPKIISHIKDWDPNVYLVQFKLEVGLSEEDLIAKAVAGIIKNRANLAVANNKAGTSTTTAAAYLVEKDGSFVKIDTREEMYEKLMSEIGKNLKR